jgi:hypothetical protein
MEGLVQCRVDESAVVGVVVELVFVVDSILLIIWLKLLISPQNPKTPAFEKYNIYLIIIILMLSSCRGNELTTSTARQPKSHQENGDNMQRHS